MVRVIVKSHQGMLFGLPQDAWKEELLNAVPLDELEKEGILIPKDFNGIAVLTAEALEIVRKKTRKSSRTGK